MLNVLMNLKQDGLELLRTFLITVILKEIARKPPSTMVISFLTMNNMVLVIAKNAHERKIIILGSF